MINFLYIGAVLVAFLATPADIDEVDCDAVQVAAKAFLEDAKREQFAVERRSSDYGEFFSEMQKIRRESLPENILQTIRDGLACEAVRESPDWYLMASLFVEAARGEPDKDIDRIAEQFIAKSRARFGLEKVERKSISAIKGSYYYLLFARPSDAVSIAKEALQHEHWITNDQTVVDHPKYEMITDLQVSIVFAIAALAPENAISVVSELRAMLQQKGRHPFHNRVKFVLDGVCEEMKRRLDGEEPRGMSMYYLDYRGPGAPVIRN